MVRITRRVIFALIALSAFLAPAHASGPVACGDRVQEIARILDGPTVADVQRQWAEHERIVRQAEPGTAYYAPYPFPKNDQEVVADFRYAYFEKLFDGDPTSLDPGERPIFLGLQTGTVKTTVTRVENWGLSRCGPGRSVPFFHLVRLFDSRGDELARGSILPTGLMGRYTQITEVGARALPDLSELPARVERMLGRPLAVSQARYAAIDGLPLHCGPLVPCAVFEASGSTWILDRAALLYEVRPDAPRRSVASQREHDRTTGPPKLGATLKDRAMVTRGFEWVEAMLVARDEEMARLQHLPAARHDEE